MTSTSLKSTSGGIAPSSDPTDLSSAESTCSSSQGRAAAGQTGSRYLAFVWYWRVVCTATAHCSRRLATVKLLGCAHSARRHTLVARVFRTSTQQRGAREPGAPAAGTGAQAHRCVGRAHGQDSWGPSAPRRGDPTELVRLAGETRNRLAADGSRRDPCLGP